MQAAATRLSLLGSPLCELQSRNAKDMPSERRPQSADDLCTGWRVCESLPLRASHELAKTRTPKATETKKASSSNCLQFAYSTNNDSFVAKKALLSWAVQVASRWRNSTLHQSASLLCRSLGAISMLRIACADETNNQPPTAIKWRKFQGRQKRLPIKHSTSSRFASRISKPKLDTCLFPKRQFCMRAVCYLLANSKMSKVELFELIVRKLIDERKKERKNE